MHIVDYALYWLDNHFNNSSRYSGISDWVATAFLSCLNAFNILVLLKWLIKLNIIKPNVFLELMALFSVWLFLFIAYRTYYRGNRIKKVHEKYSNENKRNKYLKNFGVISYMIISVLLIFTVVGNG